MKFEKTIKGSNGSRVIQEIKLDVRIQIDTTKQKNPLMKVEEIERELESVIEKYFDCCDYTTDKWDRY